jgi:hypothetical protein
MSRTIRSSPRFFRLIKIAFSGMLLLLLALAFVIPAPLREPADFGNVPNPSKSAWFLLWIQELASYSRSLVYLVAGIAVFFLALPWLPGNPPAERARWWPAEQRFYSWIAVALFAAILALTVVAMFFRGSNWGLVRPF